MTRTPLLIELTFALLFVAGAPPLCAQVEVGQLRPKDDLVATLPPDSLYEEARELVRAYTGELTTMRAREVGGERRGGIMDRREVFIALHARPGRRGGGYELVDRGVAALRQDSLYRVLYVAEFELGFVQLETLEFVARSPVSLLHVRYVQTGSGAVEEQLLFALRADDELVQVPIVYPELDATLEEGEYFCCGGFTTFAEEEIEWRVFITRSGRGGITHQVRSRFELQGGFEYDPERQQYVPRFRLVAVESTDREPAP